MPAPPLPASAEPPLTWLDIFAIGAILAVPTAVTKGAASRCIR